VHAVKAYGGVQRVPTVLNLAQWMKVNGQLHAPTALEKQAIVTWKNNRPKATSFQSNRVIRRKINRKTASRESGVLG